MRLLFAARFRDLDLLISNQVTRSSQLLFHRSLSDRLSLIAPFLRLDKDPYLVIDDAGRMSTSRTRSRLGPLPERSAFDARAASTSARGRRFDYIRNSVKITVDAYDGTMHFYVNDPTIRSSAPTRASSPRCSSRCRRCRPTCRPPPRPGDLFNVQTTMFGRYHVTNTQQFFGADDLWTGADQTSEQTLPVRGVLRRDAAAE
jgi:uncharacterized membrane protein (UPF0182 family)